jgi:hypothetical protein
MMRRSFPLLALVSIFGAACEDDPSDMTEARSATLKLDMGPQPSDWATELPE